MKQRNQNKNKNCINKNYKTMIYISTIKLLTHWSSKIPKRYKHNVIFDDLYREKNIYRFGRRCYLYYRQILESWLRLTIHNNIVNNFIKSPNDIKGCYIVPFNLLAEQKPLFWLKFHFVTEARISRKDLFENLKKLLTI